MVGKSESRMRALWAAASRWVGDTRSPAISQAVVDSALDAILVIDQTGAIVDYNPAAARILGLRATARGRDLAELLIPPRFREAHRRGFRALVDHRTLQDAQPCLMTTILGPGSREFPVEVCWAPLGPLPGLFVAFVRDIQGRATPGEMLHYRDEVARTIATNAADALFLLDADGRITYVNPAGERTLGRTAPEIVGRHLGELVRCVCDRKRACPNPIGMRSVGCGNPESPYDGVMYGKNGERLDVVCTCSPVIRHGVLAGSVTSVRNVSSQRRAERRILEISERLEAYLANSPVAAVELAADGTILRWSPAAERLFGWAGADILGKPLSALPWLAACLPSVSDSPETRPHPLPLMGCARTADGRVVDMEWHRSEFRHSSTLVSSLWLGLDVTDRNRAEAAIRESEERFRCTLEQAPIGIGHLDDQGRFVIVNRKYCEIVGRTSEELVGLTFQEITHPDDLDVDTRNFRALLEGAVSVYSREKRYIRKDGTTVWVGVTVTAIHYPGGSRALLAMVNDVSERKRGEERLRQSHNRYRFLADSMPQMVFTATPDGLLDYQNRGWLEYTGQSYAEALGRGWTAALHREDLPRCLAAWEAAVGAGTPFSMEVRVERADGEYRWHLMRATAMRTGSGGVAQWVGTATDIEDQKRAAAELERKVLEHTMEAREQARRAEEANAAKSEFLAMMGHEIRTPMNVIVGLVDLIDESALPEGQREYVGRLRRASATLLTLVNDILDLAAVESRRLQIQTTPFELLGVVDSVLSIMEVRAKTHSLKLTRNISRVPAWIVGDPHRLHQVLLNLIGNAIKFTEAGTVELGIRAAVDGEKATLTFSVKDTGIGIPLEKQAIIFEPFTQADSSITRQYGGTGLGLSISRQLVELMGGRIWLQSQPGIGTTFYFSIPFTVVASDAGSVPTHPAAARVAPAIRPAAALPAEKQWTVLLVDDNKDNVFLVQEFLKGTPYSVGVAENGSQALAEFMRCSYDMILMDIQMPGMDGHAVTRLIRSWEEDHNVPPVPILALTAHALQSEAEKSFDAGCTGHLTKPIRRQELLDALARCATAGAPCRVTATAPEGLEELSRDYLARRKQAMPTFRELAGAGDYEQVRRMAHDVKGTGASYGFAPLTEAAADLERAAASKDIARMHEALDSMESYLRSVELTSRTPE